MARMNNAFYKNRFFPVAAVNVRNNFEDFEKNEFRCIKCGVKIAFNRGIDKNDPHFKNWPKIEHKKTCVYEFENDDYEIRKSDNIKTLKSLILEIKKNNSEIDPISARLQNHLSNPSKRKFIYSLADIIDYKNNCFLSDEYNNIAMNTEDGRTIKAKDLIVRQDTAITRFNEINSPYIAILIGYISNIYISDNYAIANFSYKGKYNNTNPFKLLIIKDKRSLDCIKEIDHKLIICYGFIEKYKEDYQMQIIKSRRQIVILENRHPTTAST